MNNQINMSKLFTIQEIRDGLDADLLTARCCRTAIIMAMYERDPTMKEDAMSAQIQLLDYIHESVEGWLDLLGEYVEGGDTA